MTRQEFHDKEEAAERRHERAMKDRASWYFYLYYKILRSRGSNHTKALMKALKRHPGVFGEGICEGTASTNSSANAEPRSKPASAAQSVRTAGASSGWNGVNNADPA